MKTPEGGDASRFDGRRELPANPSVEHLKKQAKRLAKENGMKLAEAQHALAREYGFLNWAELVQKAKGGGAGELRKAILDGDEAKAASLLDKAPDLLAPSLWPVAIFEARSARMTRMLLEKGLNPNECSAPRMPLHLAVYQCLPDVVKALIERGADVHFRNELGEAPLDLLDAYEPRAVGDEDVERIRGFFRDAGVREDLFAAIRAGDIEGTGHFLDENAGAMDAVSPDNGLPPLSVAARSGRAEIASLLISRGADINAVSDKGNTALWFACQSAARATDRIAVAERLLGAGADVHRRCENGTTALHMAVWRGPKEMVELILSHGARNWVEDAGGKLPLDYARERESSPERDAILGLFSGPKVNDPVFRRAVNAIDKGDARLLRGLLGENPWLVHARAEEAGEYAGPYFRHPTLLHFVAENPTRTGAVAKNICEIAEVILDAGAEVDAETGDVNGGTTLALVATSEPARKQGLQLPLIELLVRKGADPSRGFHGAAIHREREALELLLKLAGGRHTLQTAAYFGNEAEVRRLADSANEHDLAEAANVAIAEGHANCVRLLLEAGLSANARVPHHPYSPTLLHEAGSFGRREIAELLLARGADVLARDTQFRGTPADWAFHGGGHAELSQWLRGLEKA